MSFFDTHVHFEPTDEANTLSLAHAANVRYMMAVAAHLAASQHYAQWVQDKPDTYFAIGLHPHDAEKVEENPLNAFDRFFQTPKLKAIGEIGLDYYYDFSCRDIQESTFKHFLNLALKWNLPAIVHCRDKTPDGDAYSDALNLLRPFVAQGGRFVMHCFAGSAEIARAVSDIDGYFGVAGIITFKQAQNIRDVAKIIPENRLLLETDTPWLAPVPHRGKPNHPQYIPLIAQQLADVREKTLSEIEKITTANAFKLFNIEE